MKQVFLDQVSSGQLRELIGTTFAVTLATGVLAGLKLSAVSGPGRSESGGGFPEEAGFESFALLFAGPTDPPLGQGTYRFSHERLGWFDLFIVPISANRDGRQYEAIFNRRLPAEPRG